MLYVDVAMTNLQHVYKYVNILCSKSYLNFSPGCVLLQCNELLPGLIENIMAEQSVLKMLCLTLCHLLTHSNLYNFAKCRSESRIMLRMLLMTVVATISVAVQYAMQHCVCIMLNLTYLFVVYFSLLPCALMQQSFLSSH